MSRPPSTPVRRTAPRHPATSLPQTPMHPNAASPAAATSGLTALPPFSTTSPARLQALYSDFSRQKNSNPDAYASNVDWWRRALEVVVASGLQLHHLRTPAVGTTGTATPRRRGRASGDYDEEGAMTATSSSDTPTGERLVLHAGRDLMESVKIPKVGKPLALGAVLSELRSTRTAYPLSEFLSSKASVYDPGWLPARIAAYVVGRPLWWALQQMGVSSSGSVYSSSSSSRTTDHTKDGGWWGMYVLLPLVEKAADEVVRRQEARMASPGDALYTVDGFRQAFACVFDGDEEGEEEGEGEERSPMRERDAEVLLKFLERDRGVLVVDKDVIKFVAKNAAPEERTITVVDRGILELKSAIRNLHMQVELVQRKIDECTKKASAALQQKRKPVALSHLRARKQLEDLLNKRLGSLHTLESTYITVETAAGDVEIMKSYESSTATLRGLLAHPALARSNVDRTLEALAEANADAREVDDAVRVGGDISAGVADALDEDELEAELRAMVRATEDEAEQARARAFVERAQRERDAAAVAAAKEKEQERQRVGGETGGVERDTEEEEARLEKRLDEIRRTQITGSGAEAAAAPGQAQEKVRVVEAS